MTEPILVKFEIQRFCPDRDVASRWQEYSVPVKPGMTILDGLLETRHRLDPTLAWRFSCRMGVCGSCGMVINGKPGLACNTQILNVSDSHIRLQPLANFDVVKDLVLDLGPMFEKHRAISPYIVHSDAQADMPTGEYEQKPTDLIEYLQFAGCIKCGVCMAACPTLATDERFLGPMPLTALHRYNTDSRDAGFEQRRAAMSDFHDVSHCHYAAECSRACPKGVDPARAIQLLKRDLVLAGLRLKRQRPSARLLGPASARPRSGVPAAPPFDVER